MKRYFASVLMSSVLLCAPARAETIFEALGEAYSSNPDLQAQRAYLRAVDENVAIAKSGFRPTIDLTGGYSDIRNNNDSDNTDDGSRASSIGAKVIYLEKEISRKPAPVPFPVQNNARIYSMHLGENIHAAIPALFHKMQHLIKNGYHGVALNKESKSLIWEQQNAAKSNGLSFAHMSEGKAPSFIEPFSLPSRNNTTRY